MVCGVSAACVVHVDAAGIVLNAVGVDICGDWSALVNLRHDVQISFHGAVFADCDLRVGLHSSCKSQKFDEEKTFKFKVNVSNNSNMTYSIRPMGRNSCRC